MPTNLLNGTITQEKRLRLKRDERLLIAESLAYQIAREMKRGDFKAARSCMILASQLIRDTKGGTRQPWYEIKDWRTDSYAKDQRPDYYRKVILNWVERARNPPEEDRWR